MRLDTPVGRVRRGWASPRTDRRPVGTISANLDRPESRGTDARCGGGTRRGDHRRLRPPAKLFVRGSASWQARVCRMSLDRDTDGRPRCGDGSSTARSGGRPRPIEDPSPAMNCRSAARPAITYRPLAGGALGELEPPRAVRAARAVRAGERYNRRRGKLCPRSAYSASSMLRILDPETTSPMPLGAACSTLSTVAGSLISRASW